MAVPASVSSSETSLSSLEMRVSSLETRRSSREKVKKTVSVCINKNFPKINLFPKTIALPNIHVTLDTNVLSPDAVGIGVLLSLRADICP